MRDDILLPCTVWEFNIKEDLNCNHLWCLCFVNSWHHFPDVHGVCTWKSNIKEELVKKQVALTRWMSHFCGLFPSMASFLVWQLGQRKGPSQGRTLPGFDESACTEIPSPGFISTWQTAQMNSLNMLHIGYSVSSLQKMSNYCSGAEWAWNYNYGIKLILRRSRAQHSHAMRRINQTSSSRSCIVVKW